MTSKNQETREFVQKLINERLVMADMLLDTNLKANNITKAEAALIREYLADKVEFKKIQAITARKIVALLVSARKYKLIGDLTELDLDGLKGLFLAMELGKSPYKQNTICAVDLQFRSFTGFLVRNKGYNIDLKEMERLSMPDADLDGVKPSDILSESDFDKLIKFAHNCRDKALMALFADCGVRPSEIQYLKWSDLEFTAENVRVNVTDGKDTTKKKMNFVIGRAEYLRQWRAMNEGDDKNMAVFRTFVNATSIKLSDKPMNSRIVQFTVTAIFNESKVPYPAGYACRLLRSSNITNQLKARLNPVAIMKSHWSAGLNSKMWHHYERLAGIDTEDMFMANSGHKVTDLRKKEVRESFICECGHENPAGRTECIRCHSVLKIKPSEPSEREKELIERLEKMEALMKSFIQSQPKN